MCLYNEKLLHNHVCLLALLKLVIYIIAFQLYFFKQVHCEQTSQSHKSFSFKEFVFPVQYVDYDYKHEKWNFSNGLPETKIYEDLAYYSIKFNGTLYMIALMRIKVLLPESFAITTFNNDGKPQIHKPTVTENLHCYYHGYAKGIKESKVVVSTCSGLSGTVIIPSDVLFIEPFPNGTHAVYQQNFESKPQIYQSFCGNNAISNKNTLVEINSSLYTMLQLSESQQARTSRKFVELFLVVDHSIAMLYNLSTFTIMKNLKSLVSIIDPVLAKLNFKVILSHVEIWNFMDRIIISKNASVLLSRLVQYRKKQASSSLISSPWVYADVIYFLFSDDMKKDTIGLVSSATMCQVDSVGVVPVDVGSPASLDIAASVLLHQLGHSFGIMHDDDAPNCTCSTKCIMSANIPFLASEWSICSQAYIRDIPSHLIACLTRPSHKLYKVEVSVCGNGIIEEGEECDCGTGGIPDLCASGCCNTKTCEFTRNSTCDFGDCCNNCHIVGKGIECRKSKTECDFPEYCDGVSPFCPDNLYKEDGLPCMNATATCSHGLCLSVNVQCKLLFGNTSFKSSKNCYNLNKMGESRGNCGRNKDGSFVKCSQDDLLCGKLWCTVPDNNTNIRFFAISSYSIINENDEYINDENCFAFYPLVSYQGYDYVFSGTKCSDEKICQEKRCQVGPTCSRQSCYGNGVCDNMGICHCDEGWEPPDCQFKIALLSKKTTLFAKRFANDSFLANVNDANDTDFTELPSGQDIVAYVVIFVSLAGSICVLFLIFLERSEVKLLEHLINVCSMFLSKVACLCAWLRSKVESFLGIVRAKTGYFRHRENLGDLTSSENEHNLEERGSAKKRNTTKRKYKAKGTNAKNDKKAKEENRAKGENTAKKYKATRTKNAKAYARKVEARRAKTSETVTKSKDDIKTPASDSNIYYHRVKNERYKKVYL